VILDQVGLTRFYLTGTYCNIITLVTAKVSKNWIRTRKSTWLTVLHSDLVYMSQNKVEKKNKIGRWKTKKIIKMGCINSDYIFLTEFRLLKHIFFYQKVIGAQWLPTQLFLAVWLMESLNRTSKHTFLPLLSIYIIMRCCTAA